MNSFRLYYLLVLMITCWKTCLQKLIAIQDQESVSQAVQLWQQLIHANQAWLQTYQGQAELVQADLEAAVQVVVLEEELEEAPAAQATAQAALRWADFLEEENLRR